MVLDDSENTQDVQKGPRRYIIRKVSNDVPGTYELWIDTQWEPLVKTARALGVDDGYVLIHESKLDPTDWKRRGNIREDSVFGVEQDATKADNRLYLKIKEEANSVFLAAGGVIIDETVEGTEFLKVCRLSEEHKNEEIKSVQR